MQSRRDLFQAHRLMTQRAALALLRGEPDVPDQPLRRLNIAAVSGVLVAAVAAGLLAILSLITHGSSTPSRSPGTVLIDQQTGTSYIFCQRGRLCPVLNYASALLALQTSAPQTQTVSQAALSGFRRGPMIGIAGLPPLPAPRLLVRQPWSVCTQSSIGPFGKPVVRTAVAGGGAGPGGRPLGNSALLVQSAGQFWVIWQGQRMLAQISSLRGIFPPAQTSQAPLVPAIWLDAFPEGPDFGPPPLPGLGRPVRGPGGRFQVGKVFQVSEPGEPFQYFVLTASGKLDQVSQLQADLITAGSGEAFAKISVAVATHFESSVALVQSGLPARPPVAYTPLPHAPLCAVYAGSSRPPAVLTGGTMPSGGTPVRARGFVDRVVLPPGSGALVGAAPGPAQPGPAQPGRAVSYFLVTGGMRYALSSQSVASWLGYQLKDQSSVLSAAVLDMIPEGPPLDPAAAKRTVATGG